MRTERRATVAIVDDDEGVRESLLDLLAFYGYGVSTFESARTLLDVADTSQFDCLLLDISMPGMSGIDLYKELARRRIVASVVFMTGQAHDVLINEAVSIGTCLYKPFTDIELRTALEKAIDRGSSVSVDD